MIAHAVESWHNHTAMPMKIKIDLPVWRDTGFTDQLSWIKWYGSTLMPETWDEWKTQIGER